MRLRLDQLQTHLDKQLAPIYFISGDEPLLMQEACNSIRTACKQQGVDERDLMHVDSGFDWSQLIAEANSLSLFASRKLIEMRMSQAKFDKAGSDVISEYTANFNPDNVVLITAPKIDSAQQKSKWFKAIDQIGVVLQIWPLKLEEFPRWIERRLRQQGLSASPAAIQMLAERVEGNLLAAAQEVEKLPLLAVNNHIDEETVAGAVADSSRYSVFDLVDRVLAKQAGDALKTLHGLRGEGSEVLQVLWAINREIHLLLDCLAVQAQGDSADAVFRQHRVHERRKPLLARALQRLDKAQLHAMLELCEAIDRSAKGIGELEPWDALENLCLQLAGIRGGLNHADTRPTLS